MKKDGLAIMIAEKARPGYDKDDDSEEEKSDSLEMAKDLIAAIRDDDADGVAAILDTICEGRSSHAED